MRSVERIMVSPVPQIAVAKHTRALRLWSCAMMVSGVLGVFCGVTGLLINLMFLTGAAENKGEMGLLSVWLLVLAFPMLWLTSHCLDKADELDKRIRMQRCERSAAETIHRDDPQGK